MTMRDRGRGVLRRLTARDRLARAEQRIDRLDQRLREHGRVRARQRRRLQAQAERLGSQGARIKMLEGNDTATGGKFEVLQHQLAAMERRLSELEGRLDSAPDSSAPERAQARSLLEEMRQEHRRVRAELGAIVSYEERIRRLEQALEPTAGL